MHYQNLNNYNKLKKSLKKTTPTTKIKSLVIVAFQIIENLSLKLTKLTLFLSS